MVPDLPARRDLAVLACPLLVVLYLKNHFAPTLISQAQSMLHALPHPQLSEGRYHLFQRFTSYVMSLVPNHPLLLRPPLRTTLRVPPHTPIPPSSPPPLQLSISPPAKNVSRDLPKLHPPF
ncbi:hypothetical protein EMPG_15337 [Blastomyces silverae]|uniref:Uncharacterized protein n=1 Tax=Blastomyces silverae TaxID=2060906 RepID=A0A0H1BCP2_9EURO|nr:hypothetical protein EMPG_15337 [Blastomyces silverae]